MEYLFLFGRNPKLSYIELLSYFLSRNVNFAVVCFCEKAAIIKLQTDIDLDEIINNLGGTIKIAEILFCCNEASLEKNFNVACLYTGTSNKIVYSLETIGASSSIISYFQENFKKNEIKAVHKEIAPHTIAKSNKELLSFVVLKVGPLFYVARAVKFFDPHTFRERDISRPNIQPEIMSSIRLSRILINLAGVKPKARMLDPFCGIGTILQEALLLGYDVTGVDLNRKRTQKASENLNWVEKTYCVDSKWSVRQGDATKLSQYFPDDYFDFITTEPELGPLLKKAPTDREAEKTINDLQKLYKKFFTEASRVLKAKGRISIVIPRIRAKSTKTYRIDMDYILRETGFKSYNPTLKSNFEVKLPVFYKEQWHKIERLIYILEKA
ncbi:MAG: methyltransferase domain-containing protein [Candidatus Diapherotrites archaeon]|nr:methyltransferase domain-containing protein [Candidatus Diapherotrites archaeon]